MKKENIKKGKRVYGSLLKLSYSLFFIIIFLVSCEHESTEDEDVLLKIGDKSLKRQDVESLIPSGLMSGDSVNLFHNIVEHWIKDELLTGFAEERLIDFNIIDRKVKDYRNKLIVEEYLRLMSMNQKPEIDQSAVKEYYDLHKNELKTELPLVKGVFIKISSDVRGKDEIRHLLSNDENDHIDLLEKNWMDKALSYDYFKDKWVDWETVARQIPYRFGDIEEFLKQNKYFETNHGDCTYYLQITDYLPGGSEQPFEYASGWISRLLTRIELNDFENNLIESLIKKSIEEKKLEVINYDPVQESFQNRKP